MYVITDKEGVIIKISSTIGYQSNGNPLVDNGSMAIAEILVGEVSSEIEIPEGVGEYTHTWVNGVFGENPNYEPPFVEEDAFHLLDELLIKIESQGEKQ